MIAIIAKLPQWTSPQWTGMPQAEKITKNTRQHASKFLNFPREGPTELNPTRRAVEHLEKIEKLNKHVLLQSSLRRGCEK